jgi:hypothetical protein
MSERRSHIQVARAWRVPDGGVLVEVTGGWAPDYYQIEDSRVVGWYVHQLADDCELMYISGYRVVGDHLEAVTETEVGYPYRRDVVDVGEVVLDGLVQLPDGSVTLEQVIEAGASW